jgi:hypothetical protein
MITIDEPMHHMEISCDGKSPRSRCPVSIHVARKTREECNFELYRAGWRLYKGKQLCATCAERVAARLRKP